MCNSLTNKDILKAPFCAPLFLVLLQTREAEPRVHTGLRASVRVRCDTPNLCVHVILCHRYIMIQFFFSFFFLLELYSVEKKSSVNVWFFSIMFFLKKIKPLRRRLVYVPRPPIVNLLLF